MVRNFNSPQAANLKAQGDRWQNVRIYLFCLPAIKAIATGHDCQSQKQRMKPSFFCQIPKVFGLLNVSRLSPKAYFYSDPGAAL